MVNFNLSCKFMEGRENPVMFAELPFNESYKRVAAVFSAIRVRDKTNLDNFLSKPKKIVNAEFAKYAERK